MKLFIQDNLSKNNIRRDILMNRKYYLLCIILLGILALNMSVGFTVAIENDEEEPEEPCEEEPCEEEPEKLDFAFFTCFLLLKEIIKLKT